MKSNIIALLSASLLISAVVVPQRAAMAASKAAAAKPAAASPAAAKPAATKPAATKPAATTPAAAPVTVNQSTIIVPEATPAAASAGVVIPQSQQLFTNTVMPFIQQYIDATDEAKKSAVRVKCKKAIQQILPPPTIKDWVGRIKHLGTNLLGEATSVDISLEGANDLVMMTRANSISGSSPVSKKISNMDEGTIVTFSGTFSPDAKDYILEPNTATNGPANEHDFIMTFSHVFAYKAK